MLLILKVSLNFYVPQSNAFAFIIIEMYIFNLSHF